MEICIFCPKDKSSKYIKWTRTREPLIKCVKLQADAKVRDVATKRNDTKILAIVSRKLVAAECWCHKSCYRLYTNTKDIDVISSSAGTDLSDHDARYKAAETSAYNNLLQYI